MIRCISLILLSLLSHAVFAQSTSRTLNESDFLELVALYHPLSNQARLQTEKGSASYRAAKGALDPKLFASQNSKRFDEKSYFNRIQAGLSVPTWYGIDFKAGIDRNSGVFINPENNVPQGGLWYAGISVPIGQGLFIDKRRAQIKKADVYNQASLEEQRSMLNELYFNAMKEYWYWVAEWNKYLIYDEAVELAQVRFEAVKLIHSLGDKPAIDTLEAYIQVQNRLLNRDLQLQKYQKQRLELSNYLWFENNTPLIITDSLVPPVITLDSLKSPIEIDSLDGLLQQAEELHPELAIYRYKSVALEVDRKLKAEMLKPKFNLNYNALTEEFGNDFVSSLARENYKFGLEFGFPILLRSERGQLQLSKLNIQENDIKTAQKSLEIQNKVNSYFIQQDLLSEQIVLSQQTVNNYNRLVNAERTKFDAGESSLFLVNSRENNEIKARLRFNELMVQYEIAQWGLKWSTGTLSDIIDLSNN